MKFVNLHAHSGVGSPFDGFGYPQEHMDFAFENGCEALALTDHGNMNGLAYQVLHAKKMKSQGKDFKPIFGVEAYFIPSVTEWREELEKHKADKKKARKIEKTKKARNALLPTILCFSDMIGDSSMVTQSVHISRHT